MALDRLVRIIALPLILVKLVASSLTADTKLIVADGYADCKGGNPCRDIAITEAKRSALEQSGVYIKSKTTVENWKVVSDSITSYCNEKDLEFRITNEQKLPGGRYKVTIAANITEPSQEDALAAQKYKIAENYELNGDHYSAVKALDKVINKFPTHPLAERANFRQFQALFNCDREGIKYDGSLFSGPRGWQEQLERLKVLYPESPYLDSAKAMIDERKADERKTELQKAEGFFQQGQELYTDGYYSQAKALFEQAIKIDSSKADWYTKLGNVHHKLKKWGEAISLYDKALTIDADNVDAIRGKGSALWYNGNKNKAHSLWEKAANKGDSTAIEYLNKF